MARNGPYGMAVQGPREAFVSGLLLKSDAEIEIVRGDQGYARNLHVRTFV